MAELRLELKDEAWREFISNIDSRLKNPNKLLRTIYFTYGFKDIVQHFRDEEGSEGKWPPRSDRTNEMYDRINKGKGKNAGSYRSSNKLLQLTGKLRSSLLYGEERANNSSVTNHGQYAISIFSNVKYAGVHNYGYKNIPQREYLWLSENAQELMCRGILNFVIEGKE